MPLLLGVAQRDDEGKALLVALRVEDLTEVVVVPAVSSIVLMEQSILELLASHQQVILARCCQGSKVFLVRKRLLGRLFESEGSFVILGLVAVPRDAFGVVGCS